MSKDIEKVVDGISEYIVGTLSLLLEKSSPLSQEEKYRFSNVVTKIKNRLKYSISEASEEDRSLILSLYDDLQRLRKSENSNNKLGAEYKSRKLIELIEKITSDEKGKNIFSYAIEQLQYIKEGDKPKNETVSSNKSIFLSLMVMLSCLLFFHFVDFSTQGMFLAQPNVSAAYLIIASMLLVVLFYFLFKKK